MYFVLLGPSSPLRHLCMMALGRLLAATRGGRHDQPVENARPPAFAVSEPEAVLGVLGRQLSEFNVDQYIARNPDLAPLHNLRAATSHFVFHGLREGRLWVGTETPAPDYLVICAEANEEGIIGSATRAMHFAVVLDDPITTCSTILANSSASRREVIGRLTRSLATLHDVVEEPAIPLLVAGDANSLARQLAKLVEPCRISGAERWLEEYFRHLTVSGWQDALSGPQKASAPPDVKIFDPHNADLATALEGYASLLERRPVSVVNWPSAMFHRLDAPLLSPAEPIELAGPGRGILIGPNLCLPVGSWRADSTFSVSENRRGCQFVVDIYQRGAVNCTLSHYPFELPERGTYTLELHFETSDAYAPIENRYVLHEGLIGGIFQLHGVKLVRC